MNTWTSPVLVQGRRSLRLPRGALGWFCCGWLKQHFHWPTWALIFWITVSVQPSREAVGVEFKVRATDDGDSRYGRKKGSSDWQEVCQPFYDALADHFGSRLTSGPLYLGLLYEE